MFIKIHILTLTYFPTTANDVSFNSPVMAGGFDLTAIWTEANF